MKRAMVFGMVVAASAWALVQPCEAQNPAASRGLQNLPISQDECMRRGRQALEAEGYRLWTNPGPDFLWGYKSIHTAIIMCDAAPDGKTWANVVVASGGATDGNIPGAERVRLQERIGQPAGAGNAPAPTTWTTQANQLGTQDGQRFTVACPAGGPISGRLWGTDLYTNDSSICTAAVHAGLISVAGGGTVTLELRGGAGSYAGSTRNGVTSQNYGSWGGSFGFLGGRVGQPVGPAPTPTTWTTQANQLGTQEGQRFTLACPAGGPISGRLWGTDVYTNDSSICTAAAHAGLISVAGGGTVTIELRGGSGSYAGSTRNGVTSQNYGSWGGSFVFTR